MKQIFIDNIIPIFFTSGVALLALLAKYLYKKNLAYHNLICDFKLKLSKHQDQAKELSKNDKQLNPALKSATELFTVLDLSKHKTTISETEITLFYNKLEALNFNWVIFKKHYKKNIRNINRFKPKAEDGNFELATLQSLINKQTSKPRQIFIEYLKYEWKLSSTIYKWFKKKN